MLGISKRGNVYLKHIGIYCVRINYMRQMFEGGKTKDVVREAVTNLHRPKEYWEQKAKEKQTSAQATAVAVDPPAGVLVYGRQVATSRLGFVGSVT